MATGRIPTTANSPLTTKGDLFTFSTGSAKLAVGSDGDTLVADSSTATGLSYQANFAAGKNKIINGDFRINQRGFTTTTSDATLMFDRWRTNITGDGTCTFSAQTFTLGTAPVAGYEGTNFISIATTGQTGTNPRTVLIQRIESVRTYANQTVTVSFWAKADSGTPSTSLELAQNFGTGGSPSSAVTAIGVTKFTLSTSWTRYTATINVPSISGKTLGTNGDNFFQIALWTSAGTDNNSRTDSLGIQTATISFWGVQIEAGSTATAFQTATGTIQGELAACQRYYYLHASSGDISIGLGTNTTASEMHTHVQFPVTMRTTPSVDQATGTNYFRFFRAGGSDDFNSFTISRANTTNCLLYNSTEISGTSGQAGMVHTQNASAKLAFQAEL
jgi:hypothetical protein